ncbi:MAG: hypothetical protein AAFN93_13460 [Bacteroidota bacterium]
MKKYLIIILLFAISCNDEKDILIGNTCGVDRPLEELDWLKDEISEINDSDVKRYLYLTQANYQNQTVFIFGNCCPFCLTITSVMDCGGEFIGILGTDIDNSEITDEQVIWTPEGFECQL